MPTERYRNFGLGAQTDRYDPVPGHPLTASRPRCCHRRARPDHVPGSPAAPVSADGSPAISGVSVLEKMPASGRIKQGPLHV